jgi:hypothetical protein
LKPLLRLSAVAILFAAWAFAAVGPEPSFYARREYGNGGGCAGMIFFAVGDINNDGIPDVACSGGQFMLGKGDGTFTLSPQYADLGGDGLVLLDLNSDGNLDLLGLNLPKGGWGFKVALGNGDGTFDTPTYYPISDESSVYIGVGDFNDDGIPDAVTVADLGVWLMTGKGKGIFNQPVLAVPMATNPFSRSEVADINDDGKLDIVVATFGGFAVLFGNGDGTFQAPVNYSNPYGGPSLTVADINSDGYLDVICSSTQNDGGITIFLGEAGGTFRKPYKFSIDNYEDVEVGDVNGDGIPDLVSDSVYVAYGLGKGRFSTPVYFPVAGEAIANATSLVLAHLRNEKDLDIVTNDAFNHVTVLLNKGNGSYIEGITTSLPSGLNCEAEADINGDGIADLGFTQEPSAFLMELGTGKITAPFSTGPSTAIPQNSGYAIGCPAVGDLNGDGIPDVVIPEINTGGTETLLYPLIGSGNGIFTVGAPLMLSGVNNNVVLADVNGDGKADLVTPTLNELWYGNGDGTFQAPVQLAVGGSPISSVATGDLNGDGVTDLVVQIGPGGVTIVLESNGSGGETQTNLGECSSPNVCYDTSYVGIGDVNGDGYPDLVLGSDESKFMGLYLNDGKGGFAFATTPRINVPGLLSAPAPMVLDVNGDGMGDIVVADGNDILILPNVGNLEFRQPVLLGQITGGLYYFGNWHGQSATSGLPDIAMPTSDSVVMLVNETK